jgi:hypothetical protein
MHTLVEAKTEKGPRRFVVPAVTGFEAQAAMRASIARGEQVVAEFGERFAAAEIDAESIQPRGSAARDAAGARRFTLNGGRVQ